MPTCRRWEWSTIIWPFVFDARSWLSQDSFLRLNSGAKVNNLGRSMVRLAALALLACLPGVSAHSQEGDPDGTVTLVAAPRLVDPDYRGAVLLAAPVENNRHVRSEEHTSELQSRFDLVCRLLLEKKNRLADAHQGLARADRTASE